MRPLPLRVGAAFAASVTVTAMVAGPMAYEAVQARSRTAAASAGPAATTGATDAPTAVPTTVPGRH